MPPRSWGVPQTLRLERLWENLPERPRQAIVATLVRMIASQASPNGKEVTHEDT